jgi:hypothetical protein
MQTIEHLREEFYNDFVLYAATNLYIRSKSGVVEPFELNPAQKYIHERLEKQKLDTGKVRALILKGRQQGCSTYIGGRFYHRVTHSTGCRVFILAHESEATGNLFDMVNRYHENMPEFIKVSTGASSAKELYFDGLDSGYKVGTAGNKNTGRSSTIQLFHGSEVAFWDNAHDIAGGALQAVPDMPNTEIILESTANGIGNFYHDMAMDAMRGDSEYQLIFVPWFWQPEYTKEEPKDFALTDEESEYKRAYKLNNNQIYWRRVKIKELGSDWLFKQEYPATAMEAFQTSGDDQFISPESVLSARKAELTIDRDAPLIIGVDPARFGDDRTAIVWRENRCADKFETYKHKDTMEVADIVALIIQRDNPKLVNIDVGGLGAGVYDRLVQLGYKNVIRSVNFGGKAQDEKRYRNKRAEMWGTMKEWLLDYPCKIADSDELHSDLCIPSYHFDANQRLLLESKDDIKKRGLKSPDVADALALTFAYPVYERYIRTSAPIRQAKCDSIF